MDPVNPPGTDLLRIFHCDFLIDLMWPSLQNEVPRDDYHSLVTGVLA